MTPRNLGDWTDGPAWPASTDADDSNVTNTVNPTANAMNFNFRM
jgi:hypothetical protein